jgi:hypothetical protein
MEIAFDKEYWTNQLLLEIGLSNVPREDLDKHFVDTGFVFSEFDNKKTAKQYLEEQLTILEEQYKEFNSLNSDYSILGNNIEEFDSSKVLQQLIELPQLPEDNSFRVDNFDAIEIPNFKYFEVFVEDKTYVVVINDCNDIRMSDQIKHVKNTSYFVEDRNAETLTSEDIILSYYQFANLIERVVAKKDAIVTVKIRENLKTSFEGFELKGFGE